MGPALIPGLAEDLRQAARRVHHRRRRRVQVAGAGVLTALLLLVVGVNAVVQAPPASADVEITVRDGRVVVRLTDVETRAEVVEDALRDAGIDADVIAVAVGPSNVGRFVQLSGDDASAIAPLDSKGNSFEAFAVATTYRGHLDIAIGRPSRGDEAYLASSNAFAAGEPLACTDLLGRPAVELVEVAEARPELHVIVVPYVDGRPTDIAADPADLLGGEFAPWLIVQADATSARAVRVIVTVDGRFPAVDATPPVADDGCD